jgi:hypothetical protein
MASMITPTAAFGAPTLATAASMLGASFLASSTTAAKHISNSTEFAATTTLLGRVACCADSSAPSLRKKSRCVTVCVKMNAP